MSTVSFSDLVLYFTIYSVIGWICETIYCSVPQCKLVSRGFLHGPYCPIYGFGALLILLPLEPLRPYPLAVFLLSVVLTSLLEYATSWLMERLFGIRWWDYSSRRFHINGRVCLFNSVLFGLMGLVMVYFIHPPVQRLVARIPSQYARVIGSVLVVLFVFDLLSTLNVLAGLEEKLRRLQSLAVEFSLADKESPWFDQHDLSGSLARLQQMQQQGKAVPETALKSLEAVTKLQGNLRRLLNSFPDMQHTHWNETLESLKSALEKRHEAVKESWASRAWSATKRIGRKTTAAAKEQTVSFAAGVNFYKLCWIFFVACVIGYVVETLFCLVTRGYIESRQGMLYGPFNQVYGFGAVIMVLLLHRLAQYKDWVVFLASMIIGGAFEYICSLFQEKIFGTVSWEYSQHQYNIGGRTSLTFMFFWGVLGVFLIKTLYPRLSRLIERIPNRQGVFFTWVLLILLSVNLLLSAAAVARWTERSRQIPAGNVVEEFLDAQYPDAVLREIYPNMQLVE